MPEQHQVVTDFLIDQVEPIVLDAYHLLAALDYPIADQRELNQKLEKHGSSEQAAAVGFIGAMIDPLHLPLLSPRGALETLRALLQQQETLTIPRGETPFGGEGIKEPCFVHAIEILGAAVKRAGEKNQKLTALQQGQIFFRAFYRCTQRLSGGQGDF